MHTITPAQMKALEARYMAEHSIPGSLLMEHAAMGVVDAISRCTDKGKAVFLCGPGNNGGDGYAAARLFAAKGGTSYIVEVTAEVRGDALLNRSLANMMNIPIHSIEDRGAIPCCDVIVDALFGTGLSRTVDDRITRLIHWANDMGNFGLPIIAVDIPSGIDGTTGRILGCEAIRATETVTFHRVKQGLVLGDAPDYTGKITIQPLLTMDEYPPDGEIGGLTFYAPDNLPTFLFERRQCCHKGDFGRVVIFCGSQGMAGAAALCTNAAIRSGAGLTTILCRESLLPILQTLVPGAMCAVLPERDGRLLPESAEIARKVLARADAACIGCGLGQASDVMPLLRLFTQAECPVVWDADTLNLLANHAELLPLKEADVITPHPGEAARLLDCSPEEVTSDALAALDRLHGLCGCTVLLKGARTLITNGISSIVNLHASPALAKGGSGDVLAGVITALLARHFDDNEGGHLPSIWAAAYAALIHGLAGIRAAKRHGENCTLPTDVVDCIRLDSREMD